jgi:hypothetical protein
MITDKLKDLLNESSYGYVTIADTKLEDGDFIQVLGQSQLSYIVKMTGRDKILRRNEGASGPMELRKDEKFKVIKKGTPEHNRILSQNNPNDIKKGDWVQDQNHNIMKVIRDVSPLGDVTCLSENDARSGHGLGIGHNAKYLTKLKK